MDKDIMLGYAAMACHDAGVTRQEAQTILDELHDILQNTSEEEAKAAYMRFLNGNLCP